MDSSYITSAQKANQLPEATHPEIAFLGRSNCGKSSLLNALLGRKSLARTSGTPGRTQMANFFLVHAAKERSFVCVDLPGYGFNKVANDVRQDWESLIDACLARPSVKEVLFLFDIRRDLDATEIAFLRSIRLDQSLRVVLTKADKSSAKERDARKAAFAKALAVHKIPRAELHIISSLKKIGIEELRNAIFQ